MFPPKKFREVLKKKYVKPGRKILNTFLSKPHSYRFK